MAPVKLENLIPCVVSFSGLHCGKGNRLQLDSVELKYMAVVTALQASPNDFQPLDLQALKRSFTSFYIVSTALNLAFPVIIRSNASSTLESGYLSIIGRTPVTALNRNVSSESLAVPDGQP